DLLKDTYDALYKRECVALAGSIGIGLTSFLFRLQDLLRGAAQGASAPHCGVYLDCHGCTRATPEEFYGVMLQALKEELKGLARPSLLEVPTLPGYGPLVDALRVAQSGGVLVAFLLDRIEKLLDAPDLDANFYDCLHALIANYRVAYVITARKKLVKLL